MNPILLAHAEYPKKLLGAPSPPAELWVAGRRDAFDRRAVAIVGTRHPIQETVTFVHALAAALVEQGIAIVSGGALGVDSAAHEGALEAKGTTWCVAPSGHEHVYPPENAGLFRRIAREGGTMFWPFRASHPVMDGTFAQRNRILVTLADAVVIAQAGAPSGALNAAMHARRIRRPLFVCANAPWVPGFEGCMVEIDRGARPIHSVDSVVRQILCLPEPRPIREPRPYTPAERSLLATLGDTPLHLDEIARLATLPAHLASTALLTLALEDVVVEGPAGFFRRANPA